MWLLQLFSMMPLFYDGLDFQLCFMHILSTFHCQICTKLLYASVRMYTSLTMHIVAIVVGAVKRYALSPFYCCYSCSCCCRFCYCWSRHFDRLWIMAVTLTLIYASWVWTTMLKCRRHAHTPTHMDVCIYMYASLIYFACISKQKS